MQKYLFLQLINCDQSQRKLAGGGSIKKLKVALVVAMGFGLWGLDCGVCD